MKRVCLFSLLIALLFLAACASSASAPPEPTPAGTPTVPNVASHLVHFSTSDHVQLAGLLYGKGRTTVICSHMYQTTKAIWSESGIVQRLARQGYQVLAYDFRGNGDSSGVSDTTTVGTDLRAAIAFVREQGATSIVLLGASLGGMATIQVAAHQQVTAVITLSAPQNFADYRISDNEVKAIKAPKLFVNSQGDDYANDTTHMYSIASPPKEIKMYPGFGHGTDILETDILYPDNGKDLTQRILTFVARYAPAVG
jgi:uncharacterized protein